MRQIGTALRLYTDDYDGEMPKTSHNPFNAPIVWVLVLAPYIQNAYQIRSCPSDPLTDQFLTRPAGTAPDPNNPLGKFGTSYLLNEYITDKRVDPFGNVINDPDFFTNIEELPRPADTLMVFEASAAIGRDTYWDHAHNANWFVSTNPLTRWNNILNEMEVDQHGGSRVPPVPQVSAAARRTRYDRTKGVSNFLYADGHVKAVPAGRVRGWAYDNFNFCKPPR